MPRRLESAIEIFGTSTSLSLECSKCGFKHPAAIDFHHLDPSEKEGEVNKLAGSGCFKKAYAEIEKCIPLCSNCHRILHWDESRK
jgi:predicted HNH restriction endonuclease